MPRLVRLDFLLEDVEAGAGGLLPGRACVGDVLKVIVSLDTWFRSHRVLLTRLGSTSSLLLFPFAVVGEALQLFGLGLELTLGLVAA